MKKTFTFLLLLIVLVSCRTARQIPYFSMPINDSSHMFVYESYDVPIQVGDQLSIVVSALNPGSALIYNYPTGTKGVTVDQDGYISFPQLGNIKVVGLTRPKLRDFLIGRLKTYLTDPIVLIEFVNFKITFLGEVARQGTITIPEGKVNIIEAIAQAGDIGPYGKKQQVQIIREANGRREFGWVNLYSPALFTSPYFRLRQNDIIYVHPVDDKPAPREDKFRQNLSIVTTVLGVITTVFFFITQFSR